MHPGFHWVGKSEDGQTVTLRRFGGAFSIPSYATPEWRAANAEKIRGGVVLDTETTGLNRKGDTVIEIALRPFKFNRANGDLIEVGQMYAALQDPGKPLSDEIKRLTGLTDADLAGKAIDWKTVDRLVGDAQIVVAHNAAFDRPFVERGAPSSAGKVWGCSLKQIEWAKKGFNVSKLEVLSIYHGFFAESHRAASDVDALLHLLTMTDWTTHKTYLNELLANARRPLVRVRATHSPFESKDILKERGYSWDQNAKLWHRTVYQEDTDHEVAWLTSAVYKGDFRGALDEIPLTDNFKL